MPEDVMSEDVVSDHELIEVLFAVGADRSITVADLDRSFEDLDLDSLARTEFAVRLRGRCGVDVEEQTVAEISPNDVRDLVRDALSLKAGN